MVCTKCSGNGVIPRYGHVENGVCFKCKGAGMVEVYRYSNEDLKNKLVSIESKGKKLKATMEQDYQDYNYRLSSMKKNVSSEESWNRKVQALKNLYNFEEQKKELEGLRKEYKRIRSLLGL